MKRPNRRWMYIILACAGIYGLFCLLLYGAQEKMLFPAYTLPNDHVFAFSDPFEEVFWEAPDQARLNALFFPAKGTPRGALVYFHGNGGALDQWGSIARDFTEQGLSVLVPDYRGYGKSTGKRTQKALLEDALMAYDWLANKAPGMPVYVFGRSLGSGFATYVASRRPTESLILETPYYSVEAVAKGRFPWLPVAPLLKFPMPSHSYLAEVKVPVFMIHGDGDRVIPVQNSHRLLEVLPKGQIDYVEIPGGTHNDLATFPAYDGWVRRAIL